MIPRVMSRESIQDCLGYFSALLLMELSKQLAVENREEPVLADEKVSVRLHHGRSFFRLLEHPLFLFFPRIANFSIALILQVIDIDLLISALHVNHLCLHCNLIALFRISLDRR